MMDMRGASPTPPTSPHPSWIGDKRKEVHQALSHSYSICSSHLSERWLRSPLPPTKHLANKETAFETLRDFPNILRGQAGTLARSRAQVFLLPSKWPSTELGDVVITAPHLWLRKTSDPAPQLLPCFVG